jgi:hypothetical protein
VEVFNHGRRAVLALDEFFPLWSVNAIRVRSGSPEIDAANPQAIFTHPIVFSKQPSHILVFGRCPLKYFGHLFQGRCALQMKRGDSNDHCHAPSVSNLSYRNLAAMSALGQKRAFRSLRSDVKAKDFKTICN